MSTNPIQHVVILVKENHGFDNYFGSFTGADGDPSLPPSPNPPPSDPPHTHEAWLQRQESAVRAAFRESDIPTYWSWARDFVLCDRYFTDVAGPSTPNHLMLITADSPIVDNVPRYRVSAAVPTYDLPSLPQSLESAGLTWANYGGYAFDYVTSLVGKKKLPSAQFAADASAGRLPSVAWVYADHPLSEHPPDSAADRASGVGDVTAGMQWTAAQVDAIVRGGLWPTTAVFVTWDDWGGWADHVDPPDVEQWTDRTQFRYGGRVPCLVLSPHARSGYVSKQLHSHVSLVAFCERTFGLPSLNARTTADDGMADCFDFGQQPLPPPPATTPVPSPPPITIVPLRTDAIAAPTAQLAYRDGPLLGAVEVFTVFWGAVWNDALSDLTAQLNGFFDFILTSALIDQLAEYSVPATTIEHGRRIGEAVVSDDPPTQLTDDDVRNALHSWLSEDPRFPQPSPNILYFLFLPPDVAIAMNGGRSCQTFCGYHDAIGNGIFYAVLPYPGCAGCSGGLSIFDALTVTSSHELAEAITDPVPGTGWYDDANGEIGDLCAWQTKALDGYTVQLEWSNTAGRCS